MKPAPFKYRRVESLDELLAALGEHGDDASILAGGQSLMPLMNLRMARPELLLDINRLGELSGIERDGDTLVIGALTRHAAVLESPLIREGAPLIADAMVHVAHDAIRNRGTFGGSISLADPAAELPACCVALDAAFELRSQSGRRTVNADAFFLGPYATARKPDEALIAARVPIWPSSTLTSFQELSRRRGDFALAGLAAHAAKSGDAFDHVRLVYFGIEDRPVRAVAAEAAIAAGEIGETALRAALAADLDPVDDPQTSAAVRRHFAGVLLQRAVADWAGRA